MLKKLILLILILSTLVFISGCIVDKEKNGNTSEVNISDIIPATNLPSGFTFMGVHDTNVEVGNFSSMAKEGIYRNQEEDIYIQVFESDSPEKLINEYKSEYKDMDYNPFKEIEFNGHPATRVTTYSTKNGLAVAKYTVVWSTRNLMIKVGPSEDEQKVIALAAATKV